MIVPWPPRIRRLLGDTAPPAYALWDRGDRRRELAAGSRWSFELTLVGELALRGLSKPARAYDLLGLEE